MMEPSIAIGDSYGPNSENITKGMTIKYKKRPQTLGVFQAVKRLLHRKSTAAILNPNFDALLLRAEI